MEKSVMRRAWLPILLASLAVFALALRHGMRSSDSPSTEKPHMTVVLGLPTQPSNAGWFVGLENDYFAQQGVDLVNQPYAIGLQALEAVISGKADLAMVADTPVMFAIMRGADLSIVATTYSSRSYMALVARGDHGIATPADLRGKKIGYVPSTSGHFFLYSFLLGHGLSDERTQKIVITPAESVSMIGSGALDALISWEPTLSEAKAAIGNSAVVFHGPEFYTTRFSLVGRSEYVRSHQAELKALIRGLQTSNQFIRDQPEKAQLLATRHIGSHSSKGVAALVPADYLISLEQAQLITLEDQARWALKEGLVSPQPVPNFLRHMDTSTLVEIAPNEVTLVR